MTEDWQGGERTLVKFVLNDADAGTRQSRIRRPTLSLLPPLALRTTTISPLTGEMPVRAKMFAPCVTTRRIPLPVHLSMTARAPAVREALWSLSTTTLPNVGSASTGP